MVDAHRLSLTLTLVFQVLKIMTPMVLVFKGIKIVVEKKGYRIDWSVIPVYINLIHLWLITLAPVDVLLSHKCTRLI